MKIFTAFLAAAVAFVPAVGLATYADAAGAKKKRPLAASHGARVAATYRDPKAENGYSGYYERVLDKVPFGSQLWWRVYDSYPKGR